MRANGKLREMQISAVKIRADGTRENLGVLAYWHCNPLKRAAWLIRNFVKRVFTREK